MKSIAEELTPSPSYFISECTTNKGPNDRGYTVRHADNTGEEWSPFWTSNESDYNEDATPNTSCADTSNCTTNNQCHGIWSHATNQASKLENENRKQERGFEREEFVNLSPG
jgi:hypothetical protein